MFNNKKKSIGWKGTAWKVLEIARRCALKVDAGVVIATRNDLDNMNGLSISNSDRWESLELHTYIGLQKNVFGGARKLNVVADPSSYQGYSFFQTSRRTKVTVLFCYQHGSILSYLHLLGQETMVAVFYSWEKDIAGIGPTVLVPAGKRLIPEQWEHMPQQVKEALETRKTERLASLKEWSRLCNSVPTV